MLAHKYRVASQAVSAKRENRLCRESVAATNASPSAFGWQNSPRWNSASFWAYRSGLRTSARSCSNCTTQRSHELRRNISTVRSISVTAFSSSGITRCVQRPNDPKLSDARSSSLQRMVRRCGHLGVAGDSGSTRDAEVGCCGRSVE